MNNNLVVGLGNPGIQYIKTRHNAGFWALDLLANRYHAIFSYQKRLNADCVKISYAHDNVNYETILLKPQTFMNLSGQSVLAACSFFKINPKNIIVIHDELDLKPGIIRLKSGGSHAGHNGLASISQCIGTEYLKMRIGVGRPTIDERMDIASYVLQMPNKEDMQKIMNAVSMVIDNEFENLLCGNIESATKNIHTQLK